MNRMRPKMIASPGAGRTSWPRGNTRPEPRLTQAAVANAARTIAARRKPRCPRLTTVHAWSAPLHRRGPTSLSANLHLLPHRAEQVGDGVGVVGEHREVLRGGAIQPIVLRHETTQGKHAQAHAE